LIEKMRKEFKGKEDGWRIKYERSEDEKA